MSHLLCHCVLSVITWPRIQLAAPTLPKLIYLSIVLNQHHLKNMHHARVRNKTNRMHVKIVKTLGHVVLLCPSHAEGEALYVSVCFQDSFTQQLFVTVYMIKCWICRSEPLVVSLWCGFHHKFIPCSQHQDGTCACQLIPQSLLLVVSVACDGVILHAASPRLVLTVCNHAINIGTYLPCWTVSCHD